MNPRFRTRLIVTGCLSLAGLLGSTCALALDADAAQTLARQSGCFTKHQLVPTLERHQRQGLRDYIGGGFLFIHKIPLSSSGQNLILGRGPICLENYPFNGSSGQARG